MLQLTNSDIKNTTDRKPPTRIGRYQLVGRLAKGGMAETYLALSGELAGLRSLVVVKRILPHLSSQPQFVRMFLDEARIGALLDHPNIVRIIEVGRDDDGYFLAMEPVQGRPLSAVLRRAAKSKKPFGPAQVAFIIGQAANGLGYAHAFADAEGRSLNVVHRDVSPENILVSFDGAVKVIDFGIASALGRLTETLAGGLKGKIEYMSPEQASGGAVDRRSDVFALGIVLWEALHGRRLFRRRTDLETMRAIIDEPVPPPSSATPVSPRLQHIVTRALEKEPERRFQDAREMALLLQKHAFASEGFDLTQLGTHMKRLFAADHAGWKAAASVAVNVGGKRSRKITASFSFLHSVDSQTAGPTVALHGDSRPERSSVATHEEGPSHGGASSAAERVRSDRPPWRYPRWIAGSIALIALICVAGGSRLVLPKLTTTARWPVTKSAAVPMVVVPMPEAKSLPPAPPTPGATDLAASPTVEAAGLRHGNNEIGTAPEPPGAIHSVRRAAVRAAGPATRITQLRHGAPVRRVAKATGGKRAAVHPKSAPKSVPKSTPATAGPSAGATSPAREPWHDPFD